MPTYDYLCKKCGHRFEHFQSITSDALTTCPISECIEEDAEAKGTGAVQRIVSGGAGLVFKGEGFYLTDYVRKGGEGKETSSGSKGKSTVKESKANETKTSSGASASSGEKGSES
ncbi:MAG: zinc ribbon domain-containing protein [Ignavibacteriae bacterium]|nr:zinc ribbon domain-containing protein [Ignavibacteriota bacterium]MCB9215925.1 zinc ribbon domain-containing protein [Ignavibacteria bacterium]